MRKKRELSRLPTISGQRRPRRSMKRIQHAWAIRARMLLMAWYFRALSLSMPICLKIVTEKYWIAETPVICTLA